MQYHRVRERGAALLSALIAAAVILILLTALMNTRLGELKGIRGTVKASQAQLSAEAGVDYAIGSLIRDGGVLPSTLPHDYGTKTFAGGSFHPILSLDASGDVLIKSVGTDPSGKQKAVEAMLDLKLKNPLKDFAVLSCGNVSISGSSKIVGGDVYADGNLTIGASNGIEGGSGLAKGNVEFSGSGSIDGSVISKTGNITSSGAGLRVTGYASNPLGKPTLLAPSQATSVNHDSGIWDIPDYCTSPWIDPYVVTDANFDDYRTQALAGGSYSSAVSVSTGSLGGYSGQHYINSNMTISGTPSGFAFSGVYYVTGNLTITGKYKGNATFIVDGNVIFNGTSASTASDEESHAYITRGNVEAYGTATIDGVVYAQGNVAGTGHATVNGSVITLGNGEFWGDYQVNYKDLDVEFPNGELTDFAIKRWRQVSP